MKRCPQCEFIYEDDQSLCDMDGVLLVFDSRKLPNLHALTPVSRKSPQLKRNRAVPAFASLILALVLGMVYYVSIHRKAPQTAYTPPAASAATTTVNAVPEVKPAPEPQPSETVQPEAVEEEPKSSPKVVTTPIVRKPTAKATSTPVKPTTEAKKDDSKVGSILKKTGRILKKPFKF